MNTSGNDNRVIIQNLTPNIYQIIDVLLKVPTEICFKCKSNGTEKSKKKMWKKKYVLKKEMVLKYNQNLINRFLT